MTIYFLIVFGFYFLFLLTLLVGLKMAKGESHLVPARSKFISVVVAMRNEKTNIDNLLQSLSTQQYPAASFEVIVVDDHSDDGSKQRAEEWSDRIASLKIISLNGEKGKKAALSLGIENAQGELIATTDADCVVPSRWLDGINRCFHFENANMCLGAVALQSENGFFDKLQSIEFASVMGTSISLAAMGKPTMCNGANLSFRKKIFEEVGGYSGNEHIASGDDEFLMRKIGAQYPRSIHLMTKCVVATKPQASLKDFIHQRLRWASKWKYNSSWVARVLAAFIFIVQLSWLGLMVWPIFYPSPILVTLVALKLLLDLVVLSNASRSFGVKFALMPFAALQLIYPIYVLYVGFFSQAKNHQWKGRTI